MLDPVNAAALGENGRVFCLLATPEVIMKRVSKENHVRRPLLEVPDPMARVVELIRQRQKGYARFHQLDTSELTPEEVTSKIIDAYNAHAD